MIFINQQAYTALWALIGILIAAGWVAYGMTGANQTFRVVMVVGTILLTGGTAALVRIKR